MGAGLLCIGTSPPYVVPPVLTGVAATSCASVVAGLPDALTPVFTVGGAAPAVQGRRAVSPASPYTAAWGDPPVVLVCGVRTDDLSNGKQLICTPAARQATWYRDVFVMPQTQWNTRVPPYLQVTIPDGNATQINGPLTSITDALPDSATRADSVDCG